MSRPHIYICDVCKKEKRPSGHWTDEPTNGFFALPVGDTQFKREFADVCPPCAHALRDAICAVIAKLEKQSDG